MYKWSNFQNQISRHFVCGYCGESVSSERGYECIIQPTGHLAGRIYLCHFCNKPNYFDADGNQTPGSIYGSSIQDIDNQSVRHLYDEARRCISVNAMTSAVLSCRKLLMHIAVSKGAKEGLKFIDYVAFLSDNHYIPPDAKGWVDHIRDKGNEANHEIVIMSKEDAQDLIDFIGMLLKIIYEFPAKIKKRQ